MSNFVTLVYDDEHPDFEKLSTVSFEKGLVGASFNNAFEEINKLENTIAQLEEKLAQYE